MAFHYDYHSILTTANHIKKHPVSGQVLAEHVAHDEFEFPIVDELGLAFAIAMFREVDIEVPADQVQFKGTSFTNLSEYLCCLDEYHDLDDEDEEEILHNLCLKTEMNLKDITKVRHFFACKNA